MKRQGIRPWKRFPRFREVLQIGGGIRPENAEDYLRAGASHVIVTSYVFAEGAIRWENLARA